MRILKDINLWHQLSEFGYVTFPFLNAEKVNELMLGFKETEAAHAFKDKYHHSTFHTGNRELAEQVNHIIMGCLQQNLDAIAEQYKVFAANYMIKESSSESEVVPHQDWTYVDEKKFSSFNLWVPLQDVDLSNGCLTFLPKSHKIFFGHRPSPQYPGIFDTVLPGVYSKMVPVEMKAGEGILFNHATLHGSVPNVSGKRRINVVLGMYHSDAQLLHLKQSSDGKLVKEYNMDAAGFQQIANPAFFETNMPQHTYPGVYKQLSMEDFEKLYPR